MPKRLLRLLAVLFALSLVAAACGDDDEAAETEDAGGDTEEGEDTTPDDDANTEVVENTEEVTPGGEITIGLEAETTGLRPWEDGLASPSYNLAITIFDKLLEKDAEGNYVGYLAEGITANEDLTVWTMTLRPGVVFHNGVPLTAQTIVDMFALQQTGTTAAGVISSSGLTSVEATGDLEVTYTLSRTNAGFPANLTRAPIGMVFEPAAATADPEGFSDNPVGTGPFVLESRDIDNETVVVRNENYWMTDAAGNQLPYLDKISFRPIPDETTRLQSLTSGTVDAFQTLRQATIRDAREAAADGSFTMYEFQGNNSGGGMYNVAVAPYDDVRVRNGLTHLNNQEAVIAALGGEGISSPATQFFSPESPYYSEAVAEAWPKFDVDAGTALIQEYVDDPARSDGKAAGEPIDIELSCPPDPTLLAAMAVLEQVWTATGLINVELTNFDQATHINRALGLDNGFIGDHGAHCWRWGSEDDPTSVLNPGFGPVETSATNVANYTNAEIDQLLIEGAATTDVAQRAAAYEEIGLILARDTPIWFSGHTATAIVTVPEIRGLNSWTMPDGSLGSGFPEAEGRWGQVWLAQG